MKYLAIHKSLTDDIKSGAYKPDSKLPSAKELGAMYKASLTTIQHSLHLLEKEGLVKGIRSKGIFVHAEQNMAVYGSRKSARLRRVGILYPRYSMFTLHSPYFSRIFYSIQETLIRHNVRCYLMEIKDKTIAEVFKEINALEINGLICHELDDKTLEKELEQLKLPMVHLERINFKASAPIIAANHFQGGELCAKHLRSLGHRKILFLYARKKDDPDLEPTNRLRWQGIQAEAKKNKISAVRTCVLHQLSDKELHQSLKSVLNSYAGISGIIMTTDYILRALKPILENTDQKKSRQIDIISFDQENSVPDIYGRPVRFCVWDMELMGRTAAEMLLGWHSGLPRRQLLPMQLMKLPVENS